MDIIQYKGENIVEFAKRIRIKCIDVGECIKDEKPYENWVEENNFCVMRYENDVIKELKADISNLKAETGKLRAEIEQIFILCRKNETVKSIYYGRGLSHIEYRGISISKSMYIRKWIKTTVSWNNIRICWKT